MMPERRQLSKTERAEEQRGFQDWISVMEFQLHEFIASLPHEVAVAMDFSRQSIDVLEAWLLATYQDVEALRADKQNWDRVGRYIGETFRRNTGGHWTIELDDPDYVFFKVPQLDFPGSAPTCPHCLGTAALDRRTGKYVGRLLDHKIAECRAAASGRTES
jgi:hypothetical protein